MVKYYEGDVEIYDDGIDDPTWVYHPELPSKVVSGAEALVLHKQGWHNTPDFASRQRTSAPDEADETSEAASDAKPKNGKKAKT